MSGDVIPGLVSTVIPVYNRPDMLRQAVGSVLAQSWTNIEIIISDDGSSEETIAAAESLVTSNPGVLRLVRNSNRGPGPAREAGRLLARGEFIQYLDSDDRLLPNKFTAQIQRLRQRPEAGVAYGQTRLIDVAGNVLVSPYKWTGQEREHLLPGLLVDRWWCTHTPLYRRSVTDAAGPWTDLRYSQDWEYDARVAALGTILVNCHELVSEHRTHDGNRQTGSGRWLPPRAQVRFFSSLLASARQASVATSSPEMKHFTRWIFKQARECAALRDPESAAALCELVEQAQGRDSFELKLFRKLAGVIGWAPAARCLEFGQRTLKRSPGPDTQAQSWMR